MPESMTPEEFRALIAKQAKPAKKRRKAREFQEQYADEAARKTPRKPNMKAVTAWHSCPECGKLCGGAGPTYDAAHAESVAALKAHRCFTKGD